MACQEQSQRLTRDSTSRAHNRRMARSRSRGRARAGIGRRAATTRRVTGGRRRAAVTGRRAVRMSAATGGVAQLASRGGHKGFVSKAQWRYFWANKKLRKYARKKAHATPGGKVVRYRRLPERKGVKKNYR